MSKKTQSFGWQQANLMKMKMYQSNKKDTNQKYNLTTTTSENREWKINSKKKKFIHSVWIVEEGKEDKSIDRSIDRFLLLLLIIFFVDYHHRFAHHCLVCLFVQSVVVAVVWKNFLHKKILENFHLKIFKFQKMKSTKNRINQSI